MLIINYLEKEIREDENYKTILYKLEEIEYNKLYQYMQDLILEKMFNPDLSDIDEESFYIGLNKDDIVDLLLPYLGSFIPHIIDNEFYFEFKINNENINIENN